MQREISFNLFRRNNASEVFLVSKENSLRIAKSKDLAKDSMKNNLVDELLVRSHPVKVDSDFYLVIHNSTVQKNKKVQLHLSSFFLGDSRAIFYSLGYSMYSYPISLGAFGIIFVFYGFIYLFRKEDISSLYLSLYGGLCFLMLSLYAFEFSLGANSRIDLFTFFNTLAICSLMLYLVEKTKHRFKSYHKLINASIVALSLSICFSIPVEAYNFLSLLFVVLFISAICLIGYSTVAAIKDRIQGLSFLVFGSLLQSFFQLYVLYTWIADDNLELGYSVMLGHFCMVLSFALVNAKKFASTYQKSIEQSKRLAELLSELKQKEKARTLFFHNTSHELRTPLNGIMGFLDAALKEQYGALTPELSSKLSKSLGLADSLKEQVNGILDIARSSDGKMACHYKKISTAEFKKELEDLIEATVNASMSEDYSFSFKSSREHIVGDRSKLLSIIRNLVANAAKFKDPNRANYIDIEIELEEEIVFKVSDQGIGIDKKDHELIFEEFRQVDGEASRNYEGSGLGLSIVSKLAKAMGGYVEVESSLGKGSTFRVLIGRHEISVSEPVKTLSKELAGLDRFEAPVRMNFNFDASWRILVVDDSQINCEVLCDHLKIDGYTIDYCYSALDALKLLEQYSYHLLLVDMMMPVMSGEELIKVIREKDKKLHIIAVTARAAEEDKLKVLSIGADDYLAKPVLVDEFRLRVAHTMERLRLEKQSTQALKSLQQEQQTRIYLATSLAHQMNNSLNYIQTSQDSLKLDMSLQQKMTFSLFEGDDSAEVKVIKEEFRKSFQQIGDSIEQAQLGAKRIAAIVDEIRDLSGIDGHKLESISLSDLSSEITRRLKENFSAKSIDIDLIEDGYIFSSRRVLIVAIELILVASYEPGMSLSIKASSGGLELLIDAKASEKLELACEHVAHLLETSGSHFSWDKKGVFYFQGSRMLESA